MNFLRFKDVSHDAFRSHWIRTKIIERANSCTAPTAIDMGAGMSPYKKLLCDNGFSYFSQDFNQYIPTDRKSMGLQNESWEYPIHDFICDLLDTPINVKYDLVLCTEVLEHVPDPVAALKLLSELVKPGGHLLVTVPFNSIMHQAPHWYSAGLSPFWFQFWGPKYNLEIKELVVSGDYFDAMLHELKRVMEINLKPSTLRVILKIVRPLRDRIPEEILNSSGCGTLVLFNAPLV